MTELLPCPWCKSQVMFRKALWPTDGNTDAIIHAAPTNCGMIEFSDGTTDESILGKWNARTPAQQTTMQEAFSTILFELKGLVSEGNEKRDRCKDTDPNDQQGAAIRSAYIKGLNKAISIVLSARKEALAVQPPPTPMASELTEGACVVESG